MMGQIKANLDQDYLIDELSKYKYHVACSRVTVIPGDEKNPRTRSWVATYDTKVEYEQFLNFTKAAAVDESKLIHDPIKQIADEKVVKTQGRPPKKG